MPQRRALVHASANAVAALEDGHVNTVLEEDVGAPQAGDAGADDADVRHTAGRRGTAGPAAAMHSRAATGGDGD